jgi:hypothetical protein
MSNGINLNDPRRAHVRAAVTPQFEGVEPVVGLAPIDAFVSDALESFDAKSVLAVWDKALACRHTDPEDAITMARLLLESVCKHILDAESVAYSASTGIPALLKRTAKQLNIAPTQFSKEAFKRILGGVTSVVETPDSLRNQISNAPGRGKRSVKPSARHAQLAVNMAGAAALFMVETWDARLDELLIDSLEDSKGG